MEDAMTQCSESLHNQSDELIDYERYGFGPDGASIGGRTETIRLAVLNMPHETKIEFWGAPALEQIGVVEISSGSDASPIIYGEPNLSLLDMYTRMVPKDVPVPEMLLRLAVPTDYEELRKKHPSQEYVEEPIWVTDDQLDNLVAVTPMARGATTNSGVWNCSQGTASFQSFACNGSFPSGTIQWCDASPQSNFRDRWTQSRRRYSFSITAVCNTQIGYVRHYHRLGSNWFLLYDSSIPQNRWASVRWGGIAGPAGRRARWVRHGVLNTPAGAYFRAYTAMYN